MTAANRKLHGIRPYRRRIMMKKGWVYTIMVLCVCLGIGILGPGKGLAHKAKHTPEQLKAFDDAFTEQVVIGDLLFHGDAATEKKMKTTISRTGMACATCDPFAQD